MRVGQAVEKGARDFDHVGGGGRRGERGVLPERRRTTASASAKVGRGLRYKAATRVRSAPVISGWASRVTSENRPSRAGGVRRIAGSDPWRCVSRPRWRRAASKVASSCQRWTNQATIC